VYAGASTSAAAAVPDRSHYTRVLLCPDNDERYLYYISLLNARYSVLCRSRCMLPYRRNCSVVIISVNGPRTGMYCCSSRHSDFLARC